MPTVALATQIPLNLKKWLDRLCEKLGLKKSFVVETALRKQLEDLADAYDLTEAIKGAGGFESWETIKPKAKA